MAEILIEIDQKVIIMGYLHSVALFSVCAHTDALKEILSSYHGNEISVSVDYVTACNLFVTR